MKKHFAFGSLIVALLLCVGVMAGIAFAVTPTHPVNIGNISRCRCRKSASEKACAY